MCHNKTMKTLKNLPILLVLIFFLVGVLYLTIKEISSSKVLIPPEGSITVTGHIVCLPHKNSNGPQTMECAFGLEDSNGQYYRLQDNDPLGKNINNITGDTVVEIQGHFTPQKDKVYQGIGLIDITKVTVLR
jgi:hypothetical protein